MHWQQMFSMHTCIRWDFVSFQLTLPLSLSSSISCASWWVLTLITDARAHFDNCEQYTCSRGLVYALSYVGSFGTVCPYVVSCIQYQSSGTSWGSSTHFCVPALCTWFKCSWAMCLLLFTHQFETPQARFPYTASYPESISFPDRWTRVMMLNLDG